jgi:RNA polymerase sigma-70 factor (ECF subfamily)
MNSTPISLLERLRLAPEQEAWARFVKLYTPLLCYYARRLAAQDQDADDLVQEVFLVLVQKLPEFHHDRDKSFRSWLKTILVNKWRDYQRHLTQLPLEKGNGQLAALHSPEADGFMEEAEYRRQLMARAMQVIQGDFHPISWQAFREHGVEGRSAAEVATELNLSPGAVYAAKFRVLDRLRQELRGLMD